MIDDNDDAFTPDEEADPFGGPSNNGSSDSDFEDYEIPPAPIGVLPGFVKSCKKQNYTKDSVQKTSFVFEIQPTGAFANCRPVSLWVEVPAFIHRVAAIASALGLPTEMQGNNVRVPKAEKFTGRPALFVFSTYKDKQNVMQPQISLGLPKPQSSPEWDEWLANASLSADDLAAIKKAPGVLPLGHFG